MIFELLLRVFGLACSALGILVVASVSSQCSSVDSRESTAHREYASNPDAVKIGHFQGVARPMPRLRNEGRRGGVGGDPTLVKHMKDLG